MKLPFLNKISISTNKLFLWLIVLLIFITRLVIVLKAGVYDTASLQAGDSAGYNSFANEIISGLNWFFIRNGFPGDHREPGYPFFLALIYFLFGSNNLIAVYIFQAALSALTAMLIYKLSLIIFKNQRAAFAALVWAGLYFVYFRYSGELLRETLIFFLMVFLFYLFTKFSINTKLDIKNLLILAFVYTYIIHTDGRYIFYGPFLYLIFYKAIPGFINGVGKFLIFSAFVLLLTIPWTIRNYVAYGDVILISKLTLNLTGSTTNPRGEHFDFRTIDSLYTTPAFDHNTNYPTESERQQILNGENPKNRSIGELNLIRNHVYPTKTYLSRKWFFIKRMWTPVEMRPQYYPYPWAVYLDTWSVKHNILSFLSYGLLLPFMLFGLYFGFRKKIPMLYLLILPVVVHFVLHAITFGLERYRHPIDAFIIILGTYGIIVLVEISGLLRKQIK